MSCKKLDWRNPDDYEFMNNLFKPGWAWQFIRRNPEYRKDWERELPKFLDGWKKIQEDPDNQGVPELTEPLLSIEDPAFAIYPISKVLEQKWGLKCLFNPAQNNPRISEIDVAIDYGWHYSSYPPRGWEGAFPTDGQSVEIPARIPEGTVLFQFDLRSPLNPQLNSTKRALLRLQKETIQRGKFKLKHPKPHKDNWRDYLRVYDAVSELGDNDGVFREIGKVVINYHTDVHPDYYGSGVARKQYPAVQKLIQNGFLEILQTPL